MTNQELKKELLKYDSQFLTELIMESLNRNRAFKNILLEKFNEKMASQSSLANTNAEMFKEDKIKLTDTLLNGLWKDLKRYVSKANRWGGLPSAENNKADKVGDKIIQTLKSDSTSAKARSKVLDEIIAEHTIGNSGLDWLLEDIVEVLCIENEEWLKWIEYLEGSKYYKKQGQVLRLKKLGDEASYLTNLQNNLNSHNDYVELANFYFSKNNEKEGIMALELGLINGQGYSLELLNNLFSYYKKENKVEKLDKLADFILEKNLNPQDNLMRIFNYYKENNYEKAKNILIKIWNSLAENSIANTYIDIYTRLKSFLNEDDFIKIKENLVERASKNNRLAYATILALENQKAQAYQVFEKLEIKINAFYGFDYQLIELSKTFANEYPEKINDLYWRIINKIMENSHSNLYDNALHLLELSKELYIKYLGGFENFKNRLTMLRGIHSRKKSFLERSSYLLKN
jgi:hypothetical protein